MRVNQKQVFREESEFRRRERIARNARIDALLLSGHTFSQIAERMGLSVSFVSTYAQTSDALKTCAARG